MEPSWHGFWAGTGPTPARNRAVVNIVPEWNEMDGIASAAIGRAFVMDFALGKPPARLGIFGSCFAPACSGPGGN